MISSQLACVYRCRSESRLKFERCYAKSFLRLMLPPLIEKTCPLRILIDNLLKTETRPTLYDTCWRRTIIQIFFEIDSENSKVVEIIMNRFLLGWCIGGEIRLDRGDFLRNDSLFLSSKRFFLILLSNLRHNADIRCLSLMCWRDVLSRVVPCVVVLTHLWSPESQHYLFSSLR